MYRGRSFEVWTRDGAWFWMFGEGGAIGAAASRESAVGEGSSVIDQFLRRSGESEIAGETQIRCGARLRPPAQDGCWNGWNRALEGLARYLATF